MPELVFLKTDSETGSSPLPRWQQLGGKDQVQTPPLNLAFHTGGCPCWFVFMSLCWSVCPHSRWMAQKNPIRNALSAWLCQAIAIALGAQEPLPKSYFTEADVFPQKALVSTNQHFPTGKCFAKEIPQIFSCGCGSSSVGGVLVCLVIGSHPRIWRTPQSASMSVAGI